eukprot:12501498-Alexandrium_andersonii.AAC.1
MAKTEDLFEKFCKDPHWAKAKLAKTVSEEKTRTESHAAGDMTETMLLKMYPTEAVAEIVMLRATRLRGGTPIATKGRQTPPPRQTRHKKCCMSRRNSLAVRTRVTPSEP